MRKRTVQNRTERTTRHDALVLLRFGVRRLGLSKGIQAKRGKEKVVLSDALFLISVVFLLIYPKRDFFVHVLLRFLLRFTPPAEATLDSMNVAQDREAYAAKQCVVALLLRFPR